MDSLFTFLISPWKSSISPPSTVWILENNNGKKKSLKVQSAGAALCSPSHGSVASPHTHTEDHTLTAVDTFQPVRATTLPDIFSLAFILQSKNRVI